MKQFTKFLEMYVQWIALAVALVWVGYVGYVYWLSNPVSVEVKGRIVTPSTIDAYVADQTEVKTLERDMTSHSIPDKLKIDTPQIVRGFEENVALSKPVFAQAVNPFFFGTSAGDILPPAPSPTLANAIMPIFNPHANDANLDDSVTILGRVGGLSQVQIPINAAPAVGLPGVNPPAAAAPAFKLADLGWVTISGNFDPKACVAAMTEANIPPNAMRTMFLRVFLDREELIGSTWVNNQTVAPIPVAGMLAYPEKDGIPPSDLPRQLTYKDWALNHTSDICQPLFYQVQGQGTRWRTATMPAPATQPIAALVQPDQRAIDEATRKRQAEDEQKRQAAARSRPSGSASIGSSGTRLAEALLPGSTVADRGGRITARAPARPTQPPPRPVVKPPVVPVTPPPPPPPTVAVDPNTPVKPPAAAPQGQFDPNMVDNVEIWAHDTTAEPGHTYRYKLRVCFLNPLYGTKNIAKNPDDAKILAAPAAETEWCEAVTIPSRSYFYVTGVSAGIGNTPGVATIDVLYFANGLWNSKSDKFFVGDAVAPTAPVLPAGFNAAMLDTGWFVTDFLTQSGQVVFSNAQNAMLVRKSDLKNPAYLHLKDLSNQAATMPPGAVAPGAAPGGFPTGTPVPGVTRAPTPPNVPSGPRRGPDPNYPGEPLQH